MTDKLVRMPIANGRYSDTYNVTGSLRLKVFWLIGYFPIFRGNSWRMREARHLLVTSTRNNVNKIIREKIPSLNVSKFGILIVFAHLLLPAGAACILQSKLATARTLYGYHCDKFRQIFVFCKNLLQPHLSGTTTPLVAVYSGLFIWLLLWIQADIHFNF